MDPLQSPPLNIFGNDDDDSGTERILVMDANPNSPPEFSSHQGIHTAPFGPVEIVVPTEKKKREKKKNTNNNNNNNNNVNPHNNNNNEQKKSFTKDLNEFLQSEPVTVFDKPTRKNKKKNVKAEAPTSTAAAPVEGQLINLTNSRIENLLKQNVEMLKSSSTEFDVDLDVSKEFRFKNYPVILLLLKTVLKELLSTARPNPERDWDPDQKGMAYLYTSNVPDYDQDGIPWKKTRMSVKLIVYNEQKGIYKLKNHKTDEGTAMMRRQTWQSDTWRKNEYKLISSLKYYSIESNGSRTTNEQKQLQDWPVLVHYFKKKGSDDDEEDTTPVKKKSEETTSTPKRHKGSIEKTISNLNCISPDPVVLKTELVEEDSFGTDLFISNSQESILPISAQFDLPVQPPPCNIVVTSYAPDYGPALDSIKVLMVVSGLAVDTQYDFTFLFGNEEISAQLVSPQTIEFTLPPQEPGLNTCWLSCKPLNREERIWSHPILFYRTPTLDPGRLYLVSCNLSNTEICRQVLSKFRHTVRILDLSHNFLQHLDVLSEFSHLTELTVNDNQLSSESQLCYLPRLQSFFVNNNRISNPEPFVNNLAIHFPNLQRFSMLGNPFDPVQLPEHVYWNFRCFVSSKLPKLSYLDWKEITPEERAHSRNLYEGEELTLSPQPLLGSQLSWNSPEEKLLVLE